MDRVLNGDAVKRAAYHRLRHTFASRAVQAGVRLETVGAWLGHADPRTTQIYARLAPVYDPSIELAAGGRPAARTTSR